MATPIPPGLGGAMAVAPRTNLHDAVFGGPGGLVVPGVVDALGARLVQRAGFRACYLTGAGVANSSLGVPDVGLVSLTETTDRAAQVAAATDLPVIVDADTGYGGPLSVMRTVALLESAGVAAVQLEDQLMPKRCGHFDGKRIVAAEEMVAKILAAARARRDGDLLLIARTDARAVEGLDAAIERARQYRAAGADMLFVEAPRTEDELRRVAESFPDTPLVVNVVEGGRTPELPASVLEEMGFSLVLHANLVLRAMVHAAEGVLEHLATEGETASLHDRIIDWERRQDLVHLDQVDSLEDALRAQARTVLGAAPASPSAQGDG